MSPAVNGSSTEPEYEECILCGEKEYDDADDICYACGYRENPEENENE